MARFGVNFGAVRQGVGLLEDRTIWLSVSGWGRSAFVKAGNLITSIGERADEVREEDFSFVKFIQFEKLVFGVCLVD